MEKELQAAGSSQPGVSLPGVNPRESLVKEYIRGRGIEIGALHQPLPVPANLASVKYVDRMSVNDLRKHYPELATLPLTHVDIVDDGEKLTKFEKESQDFIIANHFLEHTQDPIGTIRRHVEILKPNGILYMAVPDKRFTFDRDRPNTSVDHLIEDHKLGPKASYLGHVQEYVRLVDKLEGAAYDQKVNEICSTDYSIHFHVWDSASLLEFLNSAVIGRYKVPVEMVGFAENPERAECICILKKIDDRAHSSFWQRIKSRLM